MSIFEAYDEEFLALTQDISTNISHVSSYETDPGLFRCHRCGTGYPSAVYAKRRSTAREYLRKRSAAHSVSITPVAAFPLAIPCLIGCKQARSGHNCGMWMLYWVRQEIS